MQYSSFSSSIVHLVAANVNISAANTSFIYLSYLNKQRALNNKILMHNYASIIVLSFWQ